MTKLVTQVAINFIAMQAYITTADITFQGGEAWENPSEIETTPKIDTQATTR